MGILAEMNDSDDVADDAEQDDPGKGEVETKDKTPEDKPERVALPKPTTSRRGRAAETLSAMEKRLNDLQKTVGDSTERYQRDLSTRDVTIAELRGRIAAMSERPATPVTPAPKAAELRKQARKALDGQDFDEYERLTHEASVAAIEEKYGERLSQQAAQAPAPVPFPVQAVLNSFPDVLERPDGFRRAILEDQRLALDGVPDGPARYRQAFEIVRAQIKPANGGGGKEGLRGILTATPTARAANGSAPGPGVNLTKYELDVAKRCGMTPEEYAKFLVEGKPDRLQGE